MRWRAVLRPAGFPRRVRGCWSAARRAALEDKFWQAFCAVIGLAGPLADDRRDPAATIAAVADLVIRRTADEWAPMFAAANCCATIVRTLEEALADPHFVARGLFAHRIAASDGEMPALPLPIAPTPV